MIARLAHQRHAPLVQARDVVGVSETQYGPWGTRLGVEVEPWGRFRLTLSLLGRHQVENARVALAVLRELTQRGVPIPLDAVREGFGSARWPGRLEPCPSVRRLWWDGAHNLDGVRRLCQAWREDLKMDPPVGIVFAVARDKDARGMLVRLHGLAPEARVWVTRTRSERAAEPETLAALATGAGAKAQVSPDVVSAVRAALDSRVDGRVLLCGSLFAVGEAMAEFGGAPGELA